MSNISLHKSTSFQHSPILSPKKATHRSKRRQPHKHQQNFDSPVSHISHATHVSHVSTNQRQNTRSHKKRVVQNIME